MNVTTVGIDLAKNVLSVHGVDAHGKVVLKKTLSRSQLLECFANLPPCLIGMEACSGTHHGARLHRAAHRPQVRHPLPHVRPPRQKRRGGRRRHL